MYPLDGKTAVVTGGGSGIGRAIALRLAREGCNIGVIDVDENVAAEVVRLVCGLGRRAARAVADVSDSEQAARAVDDLAGQLGQLDIMVNSAGILRMATIAETSKKDWSDTFRINVDGVFYTCQSAIPHLARSGQGRIINISSWLGKTGKAYYGAYCASKFAIIGLTESLALELAPQQITVNAICPGVIMQTGMRERAEAELATMGLPTAEQRVSAIPLGRLGQPDDVAKLAAFLASDEAAYMTGQSINVAGGLWLQ